MAALSLALVGCNDDSGIAREATVAIATAAPTTVETTTVPTTEPVQPATIKVSASLGGETSDYQVVLGASTITDPFGDYGTCSAVWPKFGAFNVLVSSADEEIGSVQVNTIANVRDTGRAAATARIERAGTLVTSNGIMEINDDFTSGLFRGPVGDGDQVEIVFSCESSVVSAPLDRTRTFTNVAARLSRGGRERIIETAVQEGCGDDGKVELADRDARADTRGAISAAHISPEILQLWIGGELLEFTTFSVRSEDRRSGTFTGSTDDGTSVVGAYTCRE